MVWTNDLIGSPPPGLDLDESRTAANNAIGIVLFALATATMGLRVYACLGFRHSGLGWDDYLMGVGWVLCAGNLACCIAGGFYGLGKHIWSLGPYQMEKITIITFAYVFIYAWSVCIIKFSFIMLYRRIFGMKWYMWVCIGLTTCYLIINHVVLPLYCTPISFYWRQWSSSSTGTCPVNEAQFYLGIGIFNLFGDIFILTIPILGLRTLNMTRREKIAVYLIFLLGGFVCIASIIRIKVIWALTQTMDISWAKSDVFIWSSVEPSVAVMSGSLSKLRPVLAEILFKCFGRSLHQSSKDSAPKDQLNINGDPLVTIGHMDSKDKKNKKKWRSLGGSLFDTELGTVTKTKTDRDDDQAGNVDSAASLANSPHASASRWDPRTAFTRPGKHEQLDFWSPDDETPVLTTVVESNVKSHDVDDGDYYSRSADGSTHSTYEALSSEAGDRRIRMDGILVERKFEWDEERGQQGLASKHDASRT